MAPNDPKSNGPVPKELLAAGGMVRADTTGFSLLER